MPSVSDPRLIVFVTLRGRVSVLGKLSLRDEVVVTSWHAPVSQHPPLYLVALSSKLAHALALVRESGVFVVNVVAETLRDAAVAASHHSGEFVDSFGHAGLAVVQASKVDAPRLKESVAWIECEVQQEFVTGDHVCFIGKVVYLEVRDDSSSRLLSTGLGRIWV
jgi:flavin reductase (DIM6/NTAB) family NADH-FMN oxidoreductase RutF